MNEQEIQRGEVEEDGIRKKEQKEEKESLSLTFSKTISQQPASSLRKITWPAILIVDSTWDSTNRKGKQKKIAVNPIYFA